MARVKLTGGWGLFFAYAIITGQISSSAFLSHSRVAASSGSGNVGTLRAIEIGSLIVGATHNLDNEQSSVVPTIVAAVIPTLRQRLLYGRPKS